MSNQNKNDTCVFTVLYPGMEKWIDEFADSLSKQDFPDFDLVMINDGLDLEQLKGIGQKFNCKILTPSGSIAGNRNKGFSYIVKNGYRFVIFSDSDDLMGKNRISLCRELLKDYDIIVNDLTVINSKGKTITAHYLSRRLKDRQSIRLEDILDHNIIGLGNSSVKAEVLNGIVIPDELKVVDWYLFTKLLSRGCKAVFTSSASTLYRQHESNILGFHRPDTHNIRSLIQQKYRHYYHLQNLSSHHKKRFAEYDQLIQNIKDPVFLESYLKQIREELPDFPFWFESVKPHLKMNQL